MVKLKMIQSIQILWSWHFYGGIYGIQLKEWWNHPKTVMSLNFSVTPELHVHYPYDSIPILYFACSDRYLHNFKCRQKQRYLGTEFPVTTFQSPDLLTVFDCHKYHIYLCQFKKSAYHHLLGSWIICLLSYCNSKEKTAN